MSRVLAFILLLATSAAADSPGLAYIGEIDFDPCDTPPKTLAQVQGQAPGQDAATLHRLHLALYETNCGPVPPTSAMLGIDDAVLLAQVFNGHQVQTATIPLPAPIWGLGLALIAMWGTFRKSAA